MIHFNINGTDEMRKLSGCNNHDDECSLISHINDTLQTESQTSTRKSKLKQDIQTPQRETQIMRGIQTSIRDQQKINDDNSIRKKMEKRIGPSYRILLREIEHGDIEHHQVEAIASRMGGSVKTVYNRKKQTDCDLASIFNLMMDRYYQETIHDPKVDAFNSLIAILKKEQHY